MMRLYHSVLAVLMSCLVLIQIQFASSALLRRGVDFGEPHSLTRDHMSSFRSSKKDLWGCYDEALSHRSAGSYIKLGLASNSVLEATRCRPGAQRRTSNAAMMKLYHSVMPVLILSLVLKLRPEAEW